MMQKESNIMKENIEKNQKDSLLDIILAFSPIPIVGEMKFYKGMKNYYRGYKPSFEDVIIPRMMLYCTYGILTEAGKLMYGIAEKLF